MYVNLNPVHVLEKETVYYGKVKINRKMGNVPVWYTHF